MLFVVGREFGHVLSFSTIDIPFDGCRRYGTLELVIPNVYEVALGVFLEHFLWSLQHYSLGP